VFVAEGAPGQGFEDVDVDMVAVLANLVDILFAVDIKALDGKRGFNPGPVHFGDEHADLEVVGMNFFVLALHAGMQIGPARNVRSKRPGARRFTPEKLEHRILLDSLEWLGHTATAGRGCDLFSANANSICLEHNR